MSIVAAATAPTASWTDAAVAAACLGVTVPLVVRMVRRGPLDPSDRLPRTGSVWPLVVALAWGLAASLIVQTAYAQFRGPALRAATQPSTQAAPSPASQPQSRPTTLPGEDPTKPKPPVESRLTFANLSPSDAAFFSTVPHLTAFVAMVSFDVMVYGGSLTGLGLSLRQSRRGLATGVTYAVVFVPLVFGGMIVTEFVYQAVGYDHPREHDLLRVLGESSQPWVRVALAVGATVVAPLAEELLFRGHAQTILRRTMGWLVRPMTGAPEPAPAAPAWVTWGAIVLASLLFASVHERWSWPPIFLLSLCLGWSYERTGNLWVPIGVHAAFNTFSTLMFLSGVGSN
jgi:membrane protease YdiL (CAAX protease family)